MPKKSFTFNGVRKDWLHMTRGRTKPLFAPVDRKLLAVPGMNGAHLQGTEIKPVEFEQPIAYISKNDMTDLQLKDELAEWLITDEPAPLEFDDEPGRTYYALVQNTISDFEKISILRQGKINFLLLDPYGYGPEISKEFPSDVLQFTYDGTADADPVFNLQVTKPITFAMVQNGLDEYMLIGTPTDVDKEVVDTKTLLLSERGETLSSWTSAGTAFDNGKVTGGQLGTDGTGIHPLTYGSPGDWKGWYGPALMKEVAPTQDFEVEMRVRADTSKPNQLYRIEFYLYDEGMNVLGKMAVRDFSITMDRYAAEGRVGKFLGAGKNYLISQENYLREADHFHGMVRMRRIGQRFEFYVARLKTGKEEGKHHDTLLAVFNDLNNDYQGKLKYVQINIARNTEGASANVPRINAINVYALKQATVDQTPYIARPGDTITFDHKNEEILINGEDRKDLKDFGGSFFKLHKGFNQLVLHPDDSLQGSLIYRNKYR